MSGNLSVPLNTCTITARNPETTVPAGRIQMDVRTHPQGGIVERCDEECDGLGRGLSLNLCGNPEPEAPPTALITNADGTTTSLEHESPIRISPENCVWIKTSLARRFKKIIGAAVIQPVGLGNGATTPVGQATTITITNDTPESACYEVCVDVCNAFVNCPTGEPASLGNVTTEPQDITITPVGTVTPAITGPATLDMDQIQFEFETNDQDFSVPIEFDPVNLNLSGNAQNVNFTPGADNIEFTVDGEDLNLITLPTGTINDGPIIVDPQVDIAPITFTVEPVNVTGDIIPADKAGVGMQLTFNGQTCELFAADNGYNAYSGRVCLGEVEIDAGQTFTGDLTRQLIGHGNATNQFTASSGDLCVIATHVDCAQGDC